MLQKYRRFASHVAAVAVVGGLAAAAGAIGFAGQLTIHAPTDVWAGNPILGYVSGNEGYTTVGATNTYNNAPMPGVPVSGITDPLFFCIGTSEPMAPGVVTITASDFDETVTASVVLK
jgi:hypothetical protein